MKSASAFLNIPFSVSEVLAQKFVQGFPLGPYQKSIYLGLSKWEHFFQLGVHWRVFADVCTRRAAFQTR